jgi:hypothetical protein
MKDGEMVISVFAPLMNGMGYLVPLCLKYT